MALKLKLSDDQMCFGCGSKNARGLRLGFTFDARHRRIRTEWTPAKEHQGYADIVHGGMIGLVLDELMGNLLWKLGHPSVTAEMTVRFRRPAHVGERLACEARITEEVKGRARPVYRMEAVARNRKGDLVAQAAARCVQV